MFSLIVSIKDEKRFNSILKPSLEYLHKYLHDNNLPNIQIVKVSGEESLSKNYNRGITQSVWKTKFFIHEDVDIKDSQIPLFLRVEALFNLFPNTGLVGLVGTTENPPNFWFIKCKKESIVGHVFSNDQYWKWKTDEPYYDAKIVDGMFMATNKNIMFPEDISGFLLYDSNYCNTIMKAGYEIKILTHAVQHKESGKDITKTDLSCYIKKWNLDKKSCLQ
jgi:Glycosyltransferase like family